jgi:hypothetical protein
MGRRDLCSRWCRRWLDGTGHRHPSGAPNVMGPISNRREERDNPHLMDKSTRAAAARHVMARRFLWAWAVAHFSDPSAPIFHPKALS